MLQKAMASASMSKALRRADEIDEVLYWPFSMAILYVLSSHLEVFGNLPGYFIPECYTPMPVMRRESIAQNLKC